MSVILFTGWGGGWQAETSPPLGRHPPGRQSRPPGDGHCSGRYASYWNAFLFIYLFVQYIYFLQDNNT